MLSNGSTLSIIIALSLGLFAVGIDHALALFGPMVLLGVGNGMTLPSANAGIVSVRPHLAGSASGLGGSLQVARRQQVPVGLLCGLNDDDQALPRARWLQSVE